MGSRAWYKEPWMWLVVGLPVASVIAGITTVVIASRGADDPVVANYYKAGLAINERLDEEKRARQLQLGATLSIGRRQLQVRLSAPSLARAPEQLSLLLIHPTMKRRDKTILLTLDKTSGLYRSAWEGAPEGRYYVRLSDPKGDWALTGALQIAYDQTVTLPSDS